MRRALLTLALLLAPAIASAQCAGEDLVARLAAEDPATHAHLMAEAEAVPNGHGRLWQVVSGEAAPSHIFGTFHTPAAMGTVPEQALAALDTASVGAFEVTRAEVEALQARLQTDPSLIFDPVRPPLSTVLDAEALRAVRTGLTLRGMPGSLSEQMQPWALVPMLALPACHYRSVAHGGLPPDLALQDRATARHIAVVGLERAEDQIDAMRRLDPDRLMRMLSVGLDKPAGDEDQFATQLALYARGEIGAIATFGTWFAEQAGAGAEAEAFMVEFLREVSDARNHRWLPGLREMLDKGNAFVAVGALHLVGADGLVALLRAEGYEVTLVAP